MAGKLIAHSQQLPPRRVVLLGASNLARGLSTAVEAARLAWGGPLDLLAALGHGRSYGQRSALLWRELPGIAECGLWEALARRPAAPTAALVTDIGNDLLYDVPPAQIAAWVAACLDRLQRAGARVALTPLPLRAIGTLSPLRFLVLRSVLFPGCRLSFAAVRERGCDLDERVRALARARGIVPVEPRAEWYGFDPIHIKRGRLPEAWGAMMAPWSAAEPAPARGSLRRWLSLRRLTPERRWLFGREYCAVQPARRLPDGTALSLY
jgi:hypothetical protein